MSKQSSVEWLIEQVKKEHPFWTDTFEQAKAMHKEEIIETARYFLHERGKMTPQKYYNETFNK